MDKMDKIKIRVFTEIFYNIKDGLEKMEKLLDDEDFKHFMSKIEESGIGE